MQFCWKLVDPFPVFLVRLNRNDKGLLMSIQNLSGLNDSTTRHDNNKVGMQSHKVGLFGLWKGFRCVHVRQLWTVHDTGIRKKAVTPENIVSVGNKWKAYWTSQTLYKQTLLFFHWQQTYNIVTVMRQILFSFHVPQQPRKPTRIMSPPVPSSMYVVTAYVPGGCASSAT